MSGLPGDLAWRTSSYYLKPLARFATRARGYGLERIPLNGGCVLAINHIHWIDIPGRAVTPRMISFVAKIEASASGLGRYIAWYGTIASAAVRRIEMRFGRWRRGPRRPGGIFVEAPPAPGRRTCSRGRDDLDPGNVPVVLIAVYGTQFGAPGTSRHVRSQWGARSTICCQRAPRYKEATADIERRILTLFHVGRRTAAVAEG